MVAVKLIMGCGQRIMCICVVGAVDALGVGLGVFFVQVSVKAGMLAKLAAIGNAGMVVPHIPAVGSRITVPVGVVCRQWERG